MIGKWSAAECDAIRFAILAVMVLFAYFVSDSRLDTQTIEAINHAQDTIGQHGVLGLSEHE